MGQTGQSNYTKMKHFYVVVVFLSLWVSSQAQVPGHIISEGDKSLTVANKIKHHLFIAFDAGIGAVSQGENPMGMFPQLEVNAKYFLFGHLALMAKLGLDVSPPTFLSSSTVEAYDDAYLYSQYLGGICLLANSQYSDVQFSFISLAGLAQERTSFYASPNYQNVMLNISGPAFYEGFECTHLMHKFRWNLGVGYLFSNMYYSSNSQYEYASISMMSLGVLEIYMGITIPAISPK